MATSKYSKDSISKESLNTSHNYFMLLKYSFVGTVTVGYNMTSKILTITEMMETEH